MDLLQPANPKQVTQPGEPIPIPNSSPIQPVQTTFGQQGGPPMVEHTVIDNLPQRDPNEKLALCCRKQQLSSSCQNLCNFDTFTDKTVMFNLLLS